MLFYTNKVKLFTSIDTSSSLPIHLKIYTFSPVVKLFETTVLFDDTPKSKTQRSEQQSAFPRVSCFTPVVRRGKY